MPSGALTLLDASKQMSDAGMRSVIETYALAFQPLTMLPMQSEPTGSHKWDLEYQLPYTSGGARNFNADFSATKSQISPFAENVRIYGGRVQVDRAIAKLNPGKVAQEKISQIKAKARLFVSDMFKGTGGTYLRGIEDWLNNEVAFAGQTSNVGDASNCSTLLTDHMDKLLSMIAVVPGSTFIYTTQNVALRCRKLSRGTAISGDVPFATNYTPMQWGFAAGSYSGIPIIPLVDGKGADILSSDDGDSCATVFAVTFGNDMFTGFQVSAPEVYNLGDSTSYNYFDLEHMVGTAPKAIRSIARLRYVQNAV
jgi:hypothetical protein